MLFSFMLESQNIPLIFFYMAHTAVMHSYMSMWMSRRYAMLLNVHYLSAFMFYYYE